jgi:hypothetical protein
MSLGRFILLQSKKIHLFKSKEEKKLGEAFSDNRFHGSSKASNSLSVSTTRRFISADSLD